MARPRALPIAAALALVALFAFVAFRYVTLRTDMADFIPSGPTEAARFMLREIRSGAAANLILVGMEGATEEELARISTELGEALDRTGLFSLVQNGRRSLLGGPDEAFLYGKRYLLAPLPSDAFTEDGLRRSLETLYRQLQSSAAPLAQKYGLEDPPGAGLTLARTWLGESRVRVAEGVWFSKDRDRALLVARMRESGTDVAAQERVVAAIRTAFEGARPAGASLLLAGPAVFARDAAQAIRGDVELLSVVSSLLIGGLLLWRFRSLWVLAVIAVPVVLSITMAALAVQLAFGFVHGIAFGFGMTMLGVTVDYPTLLIGHRKQGEAAPATLRRIDRAFVLAVTTCVLGLTGMIFSGFPGLAQLGVFSTVGLVTGALATRWILPPLIVAADLAPVPAGSAARLLRVEALREQPTALWLVPVLILSVAALAIRPPEWEDDLRNMSPVPQASRDLDQALRSDLGVPDVGQLVVVAGADAEEVLRRQEGLLPILDRLQQDGALRGAELAARYLPSAATQSARQAALPDAEILSARLDVARAGLPFRETAFRTFEEDVQASKTSAPLRLSDIGSPLIRARLEPLLFERDGAWFGAVAPFETREAERLRAAVAGLEGVTYVDLRGEANGIVSAYARQAWTWLALGGFAALAALVAGLRDVDRVLRIVGAMAAAGLVTFALLAALGVRFSLIHIVSFQLAAGVGFDYALFFARRQLDEEERARTLRTLVTCNAMTLLTFGLLAFCRTPLLHDIGMTVAVGAFLALVFAFLIVGPKPAASAAAETRPAAPAPTRNPLQEPV